MLVHQGVPSPECAFCHSLIGKCCTVGILHTIIANNDSDAFMDDAVLVSWFYVACGYPVFANYWMRPLADHTPLITTEGISFGRSLRYTEQNLVDCSVFVGLMFCNRLAIYPWATSSFFFYFSQLWLTIKRVS